MRSVTQGIGGMSILHFFHCKLYNELFIFTLKTVKLTVFYSKITLNYPDLSQLLDEIYHSYLPYIVSKGSVNQLTVFHCSLLPLNYRIWTLKPHLKMYEYQNIKASGTNVTTWCFVIFSGCMKSALLTCVENHIIHRHVPLNTNKHSVADRQLLAIFTEI